MGDAYDAMEMNDPKAWERREKRRRQQEAETKDARIRELEAELAEAWPNAGLLERAQEAEAEVERLRLLLRTWLVWYRSMPETPGSHRRFLRRNGSARRRPPRRCWRRVPFESVDAPA